MKKDNSIVRQSNIMFTDIAGYSKMVENDKNMQLKSLMGIMI